MARISADDERTVVRARRAGSAERDDGVVQRARTRLEIVVPVRPSVSPLPMGHWGRSNGRASADMLGGRGATMR